MIPWTFGETTCRTPRELVAHYGEQLRDHAAPDISSLSDRYSAEVEKLEAEWPAFGASPGQPGKAGI